MVRPIGVAGMERAEDVAMIRLTLLLSVSLLACSSGAELDVTSRSGASSLQTTSSEWYWVEIQDCYPPPDGGCDESYPDTFGVASEDLTIAKITTITQSDGSSSGEFEVTGVAPGDATIDVVGESNDNEYTTSFVVHVVAE